MQLVNPFFFITHVIYVDTTREYIFISRSCWNSMVQLIWKRRRPELEELRSFKRLCYDTYLTFMESGRVDYQTFNRQLVKYQCESFDFSALGLDDPVPVEEKVQVQSESGAIFDQYIAPGRKVDISDPDRVWALQLAKHMDSFEEENRIFINKLISDNPVTDAMVSVIGYGRCISMLKVLLTSGSLRMHNDLEFKFMEMAANEGILQDMIRITNYPACVRCSEYCRKHIRRFFFCQWCCSINDHNFRAKDCQTKCLDESGWIEGFLCKGNALYVDDKILYPGTDIVLRAYLHNKEAELREKEIRKELHAEVSIFNKDSSMPLGERIAAMQTLSERKAETVPQRHLEFGKEETAVVTKSGFAEITAVESVPKTKSSFLFGKPVLGSMSAKTSSKSVAFLEGDEPTEEQKALFFGSSKMKF